MKKIIFCTLTALLLPASAYADTPDIFINGKELVSEAAPVIENDRTLMTVRNVSEALGYDVDWNEAEQAVTISDGNDILQLFIGRKYCFLNGVKRTLEVPTKIIDDSTYIPVRFVSEAFNCDVHWDDYHDAVNISTDIDSPQLLVNYGIIDKDDLIKGGNVTNAEFVGLLCSITNAENNDSDLRKWYSYPELEPLDYIDDTLKMQLMNLTSYRDVFSIDDVLNMDFDADITESQALVYITRLIGDTYGCTDAPTEWFFTDISQTYETAVRKGLVESADMTNADKPISRDYLYTVLCRAVLTKISVGGYSPTTDRIIDRIASSVYYKEPECVYEEYEIDADITFNSDMSVSWTFDEDYLPRNKRIRCYSEDGTVLYGVMGSDDGSNVIDSKTIVEMCSGDKPASYIEVSYSEYNEDETLHVEKSFVIDLSNITTVTEGEAPEPGKYTRRNGSWLLKSVSLADESFKPDIYYILTSYEHKYRKEEYNSSDKLIIAVNKETPLYTYSGAASVGLSFYDDIRLRTAKVTGDSEKGFVIHITPETKESFETEEAAAAV